MDSSVRVMNRSSEKELKMESPGSRHCIGRMETDSRHSTDIVQKYYRLKTESTQGQNINQTDPRKTPDTFGTERHSPDSVILDQDRQRLTLESRQIPKRSSSETFKTAKQTVNSVLIWSKLRLRGSNQFTDRFQTDTEVLMESRQNNF